jgi:hypothetical protein
MKNDKRAAEGLDEALSRRSFPGPAATVAGGLVAGCESSNTAPNTGAPAARGAFDPATFTCPGVESDTGNAIYQLPRDHAMQGPRYRGREYQETNDFTYPATTQHGGMVSKAIDARISDSWLRRAGVETQPSPSEAGESRSIAASVPGEARECWDPWETWLGRIDQPRRRRAENNWWRGPGLSSAFSLHERRDAKHPIECWKCSIMSLFSKTLDTLGLK